MDTSTGGAAILEKRKRLARGKYVVRAMLGLLLERVLGGTATRTVRLLQEKSNMGVLVEVFRAEAFLFFARCVR